MTNVTIDTKELAHVLDENEPAKAVKKYLKERRRGRTDTSLKRIQRAFKDDGLNYSLEEIGQTFKKLHHLGAGRMVYGRNGNPNRFIWNVNLRSITSVLEGTKTELEKQNPAIKKLSLPKLGATAESKPGAVISVKTSGRMLVIRKGDVAIEVSANITPEEAKGVAVIFKNLSLAS